jgi:hypothetical protein
MNPQQVGRVHAGASGALRVTVVELVAVAVSVSANQVPNGGKRNL